MGLNKIYIYLLSLIFAGCSLFSSTPSNNKSSEINIRFRSKNWVKVDADQSDYAYKNRQTHSYLIINSNCKKYLSNTLMELTTTILSNINNVKIEKQISSTLKERESLSTIATGKLDGVKTYLSIVTIKKNRCIYDFLLIANNQNSLKQDNGALIELIDNSDIK